MKKPIRLTPSLREKVWGTTHLAPWFADSARPIGEAWFIAHACDPVPSRDRQGALAELELPLLVKLIFTSQRLSVQVHPDDGEDGPRGKTEMWHILAAEPGATIALGFREPITRDHLREAARTGEIERLINWMPVKAGETYFTAAHTVHAIGAGIVLCEIQQNSDVTYRLWDYGRDRPLHVEQAAAIANLGVHPGPVEPVAIAEGRELLVRSKHFVTELVQVGQFAPCQLWICVEGSGTIGGEAVRAGEVWLLPEAGEQPVVRGPARFLRTWAPG
jgi:mannose-6-phosphate isomerase